MVRGGKADSKRNSKRRVNRNEDSDESDEDYVVSDVQSDASEDVLHDLVGSASDGSSGELNVKVDEQDIDNDADDNYEGVEEDGDGDGDGDDDYEGVVEEEGDDDDDDYEGVEDEEEEEEEECDGEDGGVDENDVVKSEVRSCSFGRKREGGKTSRKRSRVTLLEQEEDDDEDYEANGDDEDDVKSEVRSCSFGRKREGGKTSQKRSRVTLLEQEEEEDDDEDYEANGDDEDEDCEANGDDEDDIVKPELRQCSFGQKREWGKTSWKRSRVTLQEHDEEEDDEKYEDDVVKSEVRQFSFSQKTEGGKTSLRRSRVTLQEEEEEDDDDEDYEANGDDDDEDDEEFTPDEDDCLDEEEDSASKKGNRGKVDARKNARKGKQASSKQRKSRKSSVPRRKQGRRIPRPKKKPRFSDGSEDDDEDGNFVMRNTVWMGNNRKNLRRRKRSYSAESDPDFMSSGSSEFDYTISEEEREQVREAGKFCRNLMAIQGMKTSSSNRPKQDRPSRSRSAAFSRKTEVENCTSRQRTATCVKGKEKVDEANAKQVCGICFSEDKRRVRGKLDSCRHYFCFNCIMEWSKVETRCPLCKQRFKTISKPGRLSAGIDLRDAVIQVPKRDQVYQPTEEEIRGYLDPYENVICTECHQGGDDELMLLCDLCNSPAHTFCVSLGREVPEGNWYCDGCRPGVLGSSSTHSQDNSLSLDQRANNINLSGRIISTFGERLDLNVSPTPIPSLVTQGVAGNLASPRFSGMNPMMMSPLSGAGSPTLSGRRWIQSHIQRLLSISRLNPRATATTDSVSSSTLDRTQARTAPETRLNSFINLFGERLLPESIPSSPSLRSRDGFHSRQNHLRPSPQGIEGSSVVVTPPTLPCSGYFIDEFNGATNAELAHDPLLESSSNAAQESSNSCRAKEQLQCIVRSHLTRLSGGIHLGEGERKEIVRSATNTILAACGGVEHRKTEFDTVIPPPTFCQHIDRILSGRTSPMANVCSVCFDVFTRDAVQSVMNSKLPQNQNHWLSLGL